MKSLCGSRATRRQAETGRQQHHVREANGCSEKQMSAATQTTPNAEINTTPNAAKIKISAAQYFQLSVSSKRNKIKKKKKNQTRFRI
ncbi:hypothetical protein [Methanimicrococcus stummii]|uniref:hypothetical protein n=1 Tax=Methanimicrococcus stummii TaxID=3028294 RepID=UPI0029309324|nr:hypothetical protein [Methanimicrococcus sp. Es2]